jgi:hemolysin III
MFSKFWDPFSGLSHLITSIAAVGGLVALLIVGWGDIRKITSLTIYGISLILLFGASAAYHLPKAKPQIIQILRKFDHSAIYLLIAGTYTPFCAIMFTGFWRWGMLTIIWSLALIGIGVKIFLIKAPRWLYTGVYLAMGWLCVIAIREMLIALPTGALAWLVIGGLAFTLGAIVYATKKMDFFPGIFGFHEVWHIFVILGALAHFIGIIGYIAPVA